MCIDTSDIVYNPQKHKKIDGMGGKIHHFVWPCVYFSRKQLDDHMDPIAKGEIVCESPIRKVSSLQRLNLKEDRQQGKEARRSKDDMPRMINMF